MNRDEVMEMSDETLRIRAAELMGWRKSVEGSCLGRPRWLMIPPNGDEVDAVTCPNYPNDIAAAMEFVPLLIAEGYSVELSCWMTGVRYVAQCVAKRSDGDWDASATSLDNMDGLAPRAITKAFIMAMEAE